MVSVWVSGQILTLLLADSFSLIAVSCLAVVSGRGVRSFSGRESFASSLFGESSGSTLLAPIYLL